MAAKPSLKRTSHSSGVNRGRSQKQTGDCAVSRRRNSSKHQAILQATRELMEENGYKNLTLKAIAGRANVTRNVLYNWWNGDLNRIIEEALLPNVREWPIPDTGIFKDDIERFLELTIDAIHKPNVLKGFLSLAAEMVNNESELQATTRYFRAPYARIVAQILKRAEQRGEVASGLDAKNIAHVISGSVTQFAISKHLGRRQTKAALSDIILRMTAK